MRYLVSISGGAGSTLALHRTIERYGASQTAVIFADTNIEDWSLYMLLLRIKQRFSEVPFIWLTNDGRTIWDVFDEAGIIRTPTGACKASLELKSKPIAQWIHDRYEPGQCTIVSGLDWMEEDRIRRFDARWEPYDCYHPMAEEPKLSECQIVDKLTELGYPEQALYQKRYGHNNCGGGCILAGQGQWHGLWLDFPERFKWHQEREREWQEKTGHDFTVLKTTELEEDEDGERQRVTHSLSLDEFERRCLTNDVNLRDFRSTCGCLLGEQTSFFDILDDRESDIGCAA